MGNHHGCRWVHARLWSCARRCSGVVDEVGAIHSEGKESPFVEGKSMFGYRECDKPTGSSLFCWETCIALFMSLASLSSTSATAAESRFHCLIASFLAVNCCVLILGGIWGTAQKWERWRVLFLVGLYIISIAITSCNCHSSGLYWYLVVSYCPGQAPTPQFWQSCDFLRYSCSV